MNLHNFEGIPKKENQEELPTSAEEIIFEELQQIGQRNFSVGGKFYEDEKALQVFISEGRAKIQEFLFQKREKEIIGLTTLEMESYDNNQKEILQKFEYLFLYPDTQASFHEISETSF